MITDDLFAEFDKAAEANGWDALGQPERLTRRYGHGRKTLRVYSNEAGTAITRVSASYEGRLMESLGPRKKLKRETALAWLEHRR